MQSGNPRIGVLQNGQPSYRVKTDESAIRQSKDPANMRMGQDFASENR